MSHVLAIDPGEVHVGLAAFTEGQCVWVAEMEPAEALVWVYDQVSAGGLDAIVIESFEPWAEKQHSAMSTSGTGVSELIGAIKAVALFCGDTQWNAGGGVKVEMQQPKIKKSTLKIMKARGVERLALVEKAGGHASDAELHGYYYTQNNKGDS